MQNIPQHAVFLLKGGEVEAVDEFLENLRSLDSENPSVELQDFSLDAISPLASVLKDRGRILQSKVLQSEDEFNKIVWSVDEDGPPIASLVHVCVARDEEVVQFATARSCSDSVLFLILTQDRPHDLPALFGGAALVRKGSDGRMIETYYYNDIDQKVATFMGASRWYDELDLESTN